MINIKQIKMFCCEDMALIENYKMAVSDTTQVWECHHKLEIQGDIITSREELKEQGLYYNRPACELMFLTKPTHTALHATHRTEETKKKIGKASKERVRSQETKEKMSKSLKGRVGGMTGKHHNDETKRKIGEAHKGRKHSPESRRKMSESSKGQVAWNKGIKHTEEHKQKLKLAWIRRKLNKKE